MYDAKWVPVGLQSHDNEGFMVQNVPKVPRLMISHKLRNDDAIEKYREIQATNFPKPEALVGKQYRKSKHAKTKGSPWTLTPENCCPPGENCEPQEKKLQENKEVERKWRTTGEDGEEQARHQPGGTSTTSR